jgi:hypothetical protein
VFRLPLFLTVMLLAVLPTAPALAKGPLGADIEGPGVTRTVQGERVQDLTDVTHLGTYAVGESPPEVDPPAEAGPAYTVRYDLGGGQEFRQVLHPSSSAGSLIFTPAGQKLFGSTVPGGWIEAPVNLTLFLRRYGITVTSPEITAPSPKITVPVRPPSPEITVPTPEPVAPPAQSLADSDGNARWWWLALVPVPLLGVALVVRLRRRPH